MSSKVPIFLSGWPRVCTFQQVLWGLLEVAGFGADFCAVGHMIVCWVFFDVVNVKIMKSFILAVHLADVAVIAL